MEKASTSQTPKDHKKITFRGTFFGYIFEIFSYFSDGHAFGPRLRPCDTVDCSTIGIVLLRPSPCCGTLACSPQRTAPKKGYKNQFASSGVRLQRAKAKPNQTVRQSDNSLYSPPPALALQCDELGWTKVAPNRVVCASRKRAQVTWQNFQQRLQT